MGPTLGMKSQSKTSFRSIDNLKRGHTPANNKDDDFQARRPANQLTSGITTRSKHVTGGLDNNNSNQHQTRSRSRKGS